MNKSSDDDIEWYRLRIIAERRIVLQETRDNVLSELRAMGHVEVVRPLRQRLAANDLKQHLFHGATLLDPLFVTGEMFNITTDERERQRRSFAFGNANISNPNVTRELIDTVADEMKLR